jgi:hypothetical protein
MHVSQTGEGIQPRRAANVRYSVVVTRHRKLATRLREYDGFHAADVEALFLAMPNARPHAALLATNLATTFPGLLDTHSETPWFNTVSELVGFYP